MSETFQNITNLVCDQLEKIIEQKQNVVQEEEGDDYAADDMQDFATEDFITKNIRVRPVSGMNDETRDGRQSNVSRGGMDGEKEDGEERFNQDALIELDNERKNIKAILKKKLDEAERRAALEAAKKKKGSD